MNAWLHGHTTNGKPFVTREKTHIRNVLKPAVLTAVKLPQTCSRNMFSYNFCACRFLYIFCIFRMVNGLAYSVWCTHIHQKVFTQFSSSAQSSPFAQTTDRTKPSVCCWFFLRHPIHDLINRISVSTCHLHYVILMNLWRWYDTESESLPFSPSFSSFPHHIYYNIRAFNRRFREHVSCAPINWIVDDTFFYLHYTQNINEKWQSVVAGRVLFRVRQ